MRWPRLSRVDTRVAGGSSFETVARCVAQINQHRHCSPRPLVLIMMQVLQSIQSKMVTKEDMNTFKSEVKTMMKQEVRNEVKQAR